MVERKNIVVKSPCGTTDAVFLWHEVKGHEDNDEEDNTEIIDTVKWIVNDVHALKEDNEVIRLFRHLDHNSYDSVRELCDVYNQKIVLLRREWESRGHTPDFLGRRVVRGHLKHIIQQCYDKAVEVPERLNQYPPFSAEVYGETSFELIAQMIHSVRFTGDDSFIDLGSGVGQVVLQVAASTNARCCIGIEKADYPSRCAALMDAEFRRWMAFYGKPYQPYTLEKCDFLTDANRDKIFSSTVIFANNFAFGPHVDHQLKLRFANLKEGARIISSKAFCPLNFRITDRNLSDIGSIMHVTCLNPIQDAVSWTDKPFSYFVHTIDRSLLEKYFSRLKNPQLKAIEPEVRRDRKGRVIDASHDLQRLTLTDTDENGNGTHLAGQGCPRAWQGRTRLRVTIMPGCTGSADPSRAPSSEEGGTSSATGDNRSCRPYRRALRRSVSAVNVRSSTGDTIRRSKGTMNHRRLSTNHHRNGQQVEDDSNSSSYRQRPTRLRQHPQSISSSTCSSRARGGVMAPGTTASIGGSNSSEYPMLQADSLNLLHASTLSSVTAGHSSNHPHMTAFLPQYRPLELRGLDEARRHADTELGSDPRLAHRQEVLPTALVQYLELIKDSFLNHLTIMRTPDYRTRLEAAVSHERERNRRLKERVTSLETNINHLHTEGVQLLRTFMSRIGIAINEPGTFFTEARKLIKNHNLLEQKIAELKREVTQLIDSNNQLTRRQQEQRAIGDALQQQQQHALLRLSSYTVPATAASTALPASTQHQQLIVVHQAPPIPAVIPQSPLVSCKPALVSTMSQSQCGSVADSGSPRKSMHSSFEDVIADEMSRGVAPLPPTSYSPISRPSSTESALSPPRPAPPPATNQPLLVAVPRSCGSSLASLPTSNLPPRKRPLEMATSSCSVAKQARVSPFDSQQQTGQTDHHTALRLASAAQSGSGTPSFVYILPARAVPPTQAQLQQPASTHSYLAPYTNYIWRG